MLTNFTQGLPSYSKNMKYSIILLDIQLISQNFFNGHFTKLSWEITFFTSLFTFLTSFFYFFNLFFLYFFYFLASN